MRTVLWELSMMYLVIKGQFSGVCVCVLLFKANKTVSETLLMMNINMN